MRPAPASSTRSSIFPRSSFCALTTLLPITVFFAGTISVYLTALGSAMLFSFSKENLKWDFGRACSVPFGDRRICLKLHTLKSCGAPCEMSDRNGIRAILRRALHRGPESKSFQRRQQDEAEY